MEEKTAALSGRQDKTSDTEKAPTPDELRSVLGDAYGDAKAVFNRWASEGVAPADMYKRVSELFDLDPHGAEEMFGADFMDTIDYFTHYWG